MGSMRMQNPNGYPSRQHMPSFAAKGASQIVFCNPNQPYLQMDMPRCCSTNVLIEEQPSWLDDLLYEPEAAPVNKGHQRSSSDPFTFSKPNTSLDELCLHSMAEGSAWSFQTPHSFQSQIPMNTKPGSRHEQRDELRKKSSPLKGVASSEEDADLWALGMSCSSPESAENGMQNQADGAENSCNGTQTFHIKTSIPPPPPGLKNNAKRKQHNARRSRVRKLQYIAELERNIRALQVHGTEISAQLEFLDQQNLILGMENRALKQRLESLSQEHLIKSMEQEMLDREVGRLQYVHQFQSISHQPQWPQQKQNPAVCCRGQNCDLDSQLTKLGLNVPDHIGSNGGFKDFSHRN